MPQDQILSPAQREAHHVIPIYSLHLDVIRGLAALLVLAAHLHLVITGHSTATGEGIISHPAHAASMARAAVFIFFILSGYLVGGSVIRELKRNTFSWSKYALRRLTRLWTVLIPTLILGSIADTVTAHFYSKTSVFTNCEFTSVLRAPSGAFHFLPYLSFLQSINRFAFHDFGTNAALWSLSNEFWYYALFPLIAVSLFGAGTPKFLRVAFAILAAFLLWFLGVRISAGFPLWLCGVLAYLVPAKIPQKFLRPVNISLTLQFLAVLYFLRSHAVGAVSSDVSLALSFTLLLYGILHQVDPAKPSLYWHLAHCLSFPSYSLYACHIPICILLTAAFQASFPDLFSQTPLAATIILVLVLAYAGLFYLVFERNTEHLRKFAERLLFHQQAGH